MDIMIHIWKKNGRTKNNMKFKNFYAQKIVTENTPKTFWGSKGAGILVFCTSTQRFLLGLRSKYVREPGTWGIFGGAIDGNENPEKAAKRELEEETQYRGSVTLKLLDIFQSGDFKFHNFVGLVPEEFKAQLDWENDGAEWFAFEDFPDNLHFGLNRLLPLIQDEILAQVNTQSI